MTNKDIFEKFELYKQTCERLHAHVYWKDKNCQYIGCNGLQAIDLGFTSSDEVKGKTDYDFYSKEQADQIRANDLDVINTEKPQVFEEVTTDEAGKKCVYLTNKMPLWDNQGNVVGLAGVSFDITKRKKTEEKMLTEKERLELTLENILAHLPGHVYWKDKNSVYRGCNDAQFKSAGFSNREEMIGKTDYEMPWKDEADLLRKVDLEVMNSRKTITQEEPSRLANSNKVATFLSKKSPLFDKDGDVIGVLGISFDITDRKKIEKNLLLANEKAEAADQVKRAFILDIQHDLRTPLTSLLGGAHLLAEHGDELDAAVKKELIDVLPVSLDRLLEFINDTLRALEVVQGGLIQREKKFNIEKLISDIVQLEAVVEKIKPFDIVVNITEDAPKVIVSDYFAFRRILMALISNAVKFTKEGKIEISFKRIKEHLTSHDSRQIILRFEISDTGIGMSEEEQEGLFEMFAKVHASNTETYKGNGLGLFLAKKSVELLGGDIELISEENKGTTVRFDIPVQIPLVEDCLPEKKE